ncbi:hypothetical protein B0H10DRAFT_711186 [Mycena sp. CBHHK59/15]|nr:hypothetical protein B0H10DRAFT_711186 [Mycena sp. CBHHK59/15]
MPISPSETVYTSNEQGGVTVLVVSGFISLVALLALFTLMIFKAKKYTHTHFQIYFVCLLLANTMQAWGTIMNLKWVGRGGVVDGPFCAAQGGIKQGGNLGAAIWSFVISAHLFNLLFLRFRTSALMSWMFVAFNWSFIFTLVFLGPVAIQTTARGHYFGISGMWCWITADYRTEQIFLEYFFEYLSVVLSFFLHTATLLRVRGNLLRVEGRWRLHFVPLGESWQLALGRDFTDSTMLRLAQHMVWYPIWYTASIVPVSITRLSAFCGLDVPAWATALTACIFNLSGFVNVLLFFAMARVFPEPGALPEFTAQRKDVDAIVAAHGVTPFMLQRSGTADSASQGQREYPERVSSRRRVSLASINSQTPLRPMITARSPTNIAYLQEQDSD